MPTYGIKASQEGHDVKTAADKDLVFSSEWNTFKIVERGMAIVEAAYSETGSTDISHSLGYIPTVVAYAELEDDKFYKEQTALPSGGVFRVYAYSNKVTFEVENWGGWKRFKIYYFFMIEEE